MKLEYLLEGSDDCPLIRLYEGTRQDYKLLVSVIDDLLNGRKESVSVDELVGYNPIGNIKLEFVLSDTNIGIAQSTEDKFKCTLTRERWLKVKHLIVPFLNENEGKYQWLEESSNISLLISDTGKW